MISRNLMELSEAESTKIIRARLRNLGESYAGATKEKASRAIAIIDELLEQYALLAHVVDEASSLVGIRKREERVKELLNGASVVLVTQQVAVRDRGLLDNARREVRATPAEVLATMEQSFAVARDALSAIVDAMTHVRPRVAALAQEIATLGHWATTLGAASVAPPTISAVLLRVESDPLGCAGEVSQVETAMIRWRAELQAIDAERKAIFVSIERGKAMLIELRDLLVRSRAAFTEARETLAYPESLVTPSDDGARESLAIWLQTLEQNAAVGNFAAVKVGMAKWEQKCSDLLNDVRTSYAHNTAGLDERAELRGRFKALCAKADILRGRGVVLGQTVDTLSRQAKDVLDTIPFDNQAGRRVVASFEAAVSATQR